MKSRRIKKAVIPAAGLGTRFLPVTKAIPKEMLPIVDRPAIHYIVQEAIASGCDEIVLVTSQHKEQIQHYFDYHRELDDRLRASGKADLADSMKAIADSCHLICVYQKEPLGLGHAVLCAEKVVGDEPFLVLLPDDLMDGSQPCSAQLMASAQRTGLSTVAVMEVPQADVSKYGIVAGTETATRTYRVSDLIEKPSPQEAPSRWAIPGRYVLDAKVFEYIKQTPRGKGGEIQLTDALRILAKNEGLSAYAFEGRRFDTGDRLGYLDAVMTFALRRPDLAAGLKQLMAQAIKEQK